MRKAFVLLLLSSSLFAQCTRLSWNPLTRTLDCVGSGLGSCSQGGSVLTCGGFISAGTGAGYFNFKGSTGDYYRGFVGITGSYTATVRFQPADATPADHSVLMVGAPTDGISSMQAKVIPDCDNAGGNRLNYDQSTGLYTCGASIGTVFAGSAVNNTVAAATTTYFAPIATTFNATAATRKVLAPAAGTLRDLYVRTAAAQPANGAMTITAVVAGSDTAVVITIAAGAAAATYSNTTNTAAVAAGDLITIKFVNASPDTASGGVYEISWRII